MRKMTNEQYWMRRDRDAKMENLYGCPVDLPEEENDLMPRPGIVQNLVFCALVVGISAIGYILFNALH